MAATGKRHGAGKGRPYEKHVYWMSAEQETRLTQQLSAQGIRVKTARGVVCTPLDPIPTVGRVPPGVWSETCARQGSWYRTSEKRGLTLVVSPFDLPEWRGQKAARITASRFSPPRLAGEADKRALVEAVRERIPEAWNRVTEVERRIALRWVRRLGSGLDDYTALHLSHTANHANFISPRLYVRDGAQIIPYSIERSAHVCSCCLELFQVLGPRFRRKLVVPCPGATIFARLKPDQYLLVEGT